MNWWQQVTSTIVAEFSDIPSFTELTQLTLRLLLAGVLGGVLGYEREHKGKAAGMRTHMLVAMGAAMFVLIPKLAGVADTDITRIVQGLVAGIGFLGAGTIVKGNHQDEVYGLTTAAGIWMTAAIGVAAGMGRDASAVLSTVLALIVLAVLPTSASLLRKPDNSSAGDTAAEKKAEQRRET